MEPTPELKKIASELATGGTDGALLQSLMENATQLREALLPFERVQKLNPDQLLAVQHGQRLAEQIRRDDEAMAQRIGADKPAYTPKRTIWSRFAWWRK